MASKRMFSRTITETDAFISMPLSTQALYFHLCLGADNDGFIGNPKMIARMVGASEEDIRTLAEQRFILEFDDAIVIKHWRIHNELSRNYYSETNYIEDKAKLKIKENQAYTLGEGSPIDDSELIKKRGAKKTTTQETRADNADNAQEPRAESAQDKIRRDKKRLDKDRLEEIRRDNSFGNGYFEDEDLNNAFIEYVKMRNEYNKPLTTTTIEMAIDELIKLSNGDNETAIKIINQSLVNGWTGLFELKNKSANKSQGLDDFYTMAQEWADERGNK